MLQGRKFDPDGTYVRLWVPELANLPDKYIHRPWATPEDILKDSGVSLGSSYPFPIVDHMAARNRALEMFRQLKS